MELSGRQGLSDRRSLVISAGAVMVAGLALVAIRESAGTPGKPEGVAASVAFAAPFLTAGGLALWGTVRRRFVLVICVSVALWPISTVSIVMFPVLVPAVVLINAAARRTRTTSPTEWVFGALTAVGIVTSFFALILHDDPVSWTTPTGGGSSEDMITNTEIALALVLLAASCLLAFSQRATERTERARSRPR